MIQKSSCCRASVYVDRQSHYCCNSCNKQCSIVDVVQPQPTPEAIQSNLITLAGAVQQLRIKLNIPLASFHFAPDGAWCSLEHEVNDDNGKLQDEQFSIIRKHPGCSTTLAKI